MNRVPPLVKDAHYDDEAPTLAYTKAAMMYKKKTFRGSVAAVLYESLSWLVDCGFTCMSALSNPAKGNVRFR